MSFEVPADAYGRFMGRYSEQLAVGFAELLDLRPGQRALDVGCGPGALTAQLVARLGPDAVTAIDPSPPFVEAARSRFPGARVLLSGAESTPFEDDEFDCAAAQLVVNFMSDPSVGLAEMARVTRPGGPLAACVWDHAGERGPLSAFWRAVREVDPRARDESDLAGARHGSLALLFEQAGLVDVTPSELTVRVRYSTFEQWWEPYTLGVGTAGAHVATLVPARRAELRDRCAAMLPAAPFEINATAWTVVGRAR